MATLAGDKVRKYEASNSETFNDLPVVASDIIYEGAAVSLRSSGYVGPLAAAEKFVGFAVRQVDNSAGAAGDAKCRLRRSGAVQIPVVGVDGVDDVSKQVYASDDDTFTLTATSNSKIGRIIRWVTGTTCIVAFNDQET
ncbi:cytoplasmic protein [Nitrospira sp. Nam74]